MGIIEMFKKAFGGGKTVPDKKLGRNDPCWCGSGKKYKRCHLQADEKKRSAILARNTCKAPA
jgi:uncharacterized protein YecA (UPF0149 family)